MTIRCLVLVYLAAVLAGGFLSGCAASQGSGSKGGSGSPEKTEGSGPPGSADAHRPPGSTLSYGGEAVSGELGTYCWVSGCVDKVGIPINEEALSVPAGSSMTFEYGGKKLDSLSATADRIGRGNHLERIGRVSVLVSDEGSKGSQTVRLRSYRSGNRARIVADLAAGEYAVAVFVRVSQGDALYGFRVVVE
jgi:hypothetical protein